MRLPRDISILRDIAEHLKVSKDELIQELWGRNR